MDYQTVADRLGQENDARFQSKVDTALETLSTYLGYSLTPSGDTEKRLFNVEEYAVWQRVAPFYELTTVRINDGKFSTTLTNYLLGQNGELHGDWYNGIRLCECSALCHCRIANCSYFEIDAKWGFRAPLEKDEETYVYLPADLWEVIDSMVTEKTDTKRNIKSESRGSRSYTKFDPKDFRQEFSDTLRKYKRGW